MKDLMSADFPYAEYPVRYARTQEVLRGQGIDALLLTGRQNLRYFAGLRDGAWDAHHFYFLVVLPAAGDPVLLVSNGFQHLVKQCWIEDVRFWPLSSAFYMSKESHAVSLVLEVLKEKGLERGAIGMELSSDLQPNMAHDHFSAIIAGLPHAHIVDGSEAVWAVRSTKSPAEISRLRRAADISAKGVKAAFEQLVPGMTEKAAVDIMTSVMCAEGASELRFNALYAGPRAMVGRWSAHGLCHAAGGSGAVRWRLYLRGVLVRFQAHGGRGRAAVGSAAFLRTGPRGTRSGH